MRAIDPWPAAPVLAELPAVAQLNARFDVTGLTDDLTHIESTNWSAINIMTGDGVGRPITTLDWRTIPLRSIGGADDRTDPGGPDLAEFADTSWAARLLRFADILRAVPGPIRAARLMALGPGARSPLHSDTKVGLPWGTVRLHVPVVTLPEATLLINDERHCWEAGRLWYADFTRAHAVENTGDRRRIHFVIDVQVTEPLLDLFPPEFQMPARRARFLPQPAPTSLGTDTEALLGAFSVPASFLSFEAPDGHHVTDPDMLSARVTRTDGALVLEVDGEPRFGLVHVGDNEFRFAGWTTERTMQVRLHEGRAAGVVLRTRQGADTVWAREVMVDAPVHVNGP